MSTPTAPALPVLHALIRLADPIDPTIDAAQRLYGNGPKRRPSVVLNRTQVGHILARWRTGEITSTQLQRWARAINLHHCALVKRPYFGYEPGYTRAISEAIISLAIDRDLPYAGALISRLESRLGQPDPEPQPRRWQVSFALGGRRS